MSNSVKIKLLVSIMDSLINTTYSAAYYIGNIGKKLLPKTFYYNIIGIVLYLVLYCITHLKHHLVEKLIIILCIFYSFNSIKFTICIVKYFGK